MPTIRREWISKNRLRELLWHERSLAETAAKLADTTHSDVVHDTAMEVAALAEQSAIAIERCLPAAVVSRVPDGTTALHRVGVTLSALGDRVSLVLLASSVSAQARRLHGVLEDIAGVDDEAYELILSRLIPEHQETVTRLRSARHRARRPAPGHATSA